MVLDAETKVFLDFMQTFLDFSPGSLKLPHKIRLTKTSLFDNWTIKLLNIMIFYSLTLSLINRYLVISYKYVIHVNISNSSMETTFECHNEIRKQVILII